MQHAIFIAFFFYYCVILSYSFVPLQQTSQLCVFLYMLIYGKFHKEMNSSHLTPHSTLLRETSRISGRIRIEKHFLFFFVNSFLFINYFLSAQFCLGMAPQHLSPYLLILVTYAEMSCFEWISSFLTSCQCLRKKFGSQMRSWSFVGPSLRCDVLFCIWAPTEKGG